MGCSTPFVQSWGVIVAEAWNHTARYDASVKVNVLPICYILLCIRSVSLWINQLLSISPHFECREHLIRWFVTNVLLFMVKQILVYWPEECFLWALTNPRSLHAPTGISVKHSAGYNSGCDPTIALSVLLCGPVRHSITCAWLTVFSSISHGLLAPKADPLPTRRRHLSMC